MKSRLLISTVFLIFVCTACSQSKEVVQTISITPSFFPTKNVQPVSATPALPTLTSTAELYRKTPYDFTYNNDDELISIIDELFPGNCIKDEENLVTTEVQYIEPFMQVGSLEFNKIPELPQVKSNYFNEYAENYDNSRVALAVCQEGDCSKLYVQDNKSGYVYAIDLGWDPYRPLNLLHWINDDTVVFGQIEHMATIIAAVNIENQEYEYYGVISGCKPTPVPVQITTDTVD